MFINRYCHESFPADFVVVMYFVVLSAVFLFLVVGLVLQCGCEYLLLGDDTILILCPILFLFTVL